MNLPEEVSALVEDFGGLDQDSIKNFFDKLHKEKSYSDFQLKIFSISNSAKSNFLQVGLTNFLESPSFSTLNLNLLFFTSLLFRGIKKEEKKEFYKIFNLISQKILELYSYKLREKFS